MADLEAPRFPEEISVGSQFGPGYSTRLARNLGGKTAVNKNRDNALYEGDVLHGVRSQEQLNDLLAFFQHVGGRFLCWRFKHFGDFLVAFGEGYLVEITANTTWQCWRRRTFGPALGNHKVQKLVSGTIAVQGGGSYTIDHNTGIITRTSGANPTGWTGEFDFRCRFNTDKMLPSWISFELYDWGPVPIIEDPL